MFNKKILLIATGYVLGNIIASIYNEKKGKDLKEEMKQAEADGKGSCKVVFNHILDIHRNLLANLKSEVMSESNKELFNRKKDELVNLVEDYKIQGEKLLIKLQDKGVDYTGEVKAELEKLYEKKKKDIERIKQEAPEKVEEMKDKLLGYFENLKNKIKG